MVGADAGIELQRNLHGLEPVAQAIGKRGEVEAIRGARKGRAEAAIFALKHILNPGVALLCEKRAVITRLRRAAGMHTLNHRPILRGHEARRLGAANADGVDGLSDIEPQGARRARRRRENAERRAGVPALADMFLPHADADAGADLVTGNCRSEEFLARDGRILLEYGQNAGQGHGAHMQNAHAMHIVELEALHQRAIDEDCVGRGELILCSPYR